VSNHAVEHLLRAEAPQVLAALVRRFGRFDLAEDAVQEALLAASRTWPVDGVPADPRSWLIRIGYRRLVDLLRSDRARRRREYATATAVPPGPVSGVDDSVTLLLLCCHPSLAATARVALTLRAVGASPQPRSPTRTGSPRTP
jgi:predicted RNA polymerase sigma factor